MIDDRVELRVSQKRSDSRLDRFLSERLSAELGMPISRGDARWLLGTGCVQVDGRPVDRSSLRLSVGVDVHVRDLPALVARVRERTQPIEVGEDRFVYEDETLIVVDKPAGLPAHATRDPERDNLLAAVARTLDNRGEHASGLLACHRLDRGTSGLIILARTAEAAGAMGESLAQRRVDKTYLAEIEAAQMPLEFQEDGRIETLRGRSRVVPRGGRAARTRFRRVGATDDRFQLAAQPMTGRTHQIRVHLLHRGNPIIGDVLYGGRPASRLMLHAWKLQFEHPSSGARVSLEAPAPADFLPAV